MAGDALALIAQEGLAAGHGFEDTAFAFFAEVVFDAAMTGDEAHDAFGQVDVEVVTDDAPTYCWRGGAYKAIEEGGDQGFPDMPVYSKLQEIIVVLLVYLMTPYSSYR